MMLTIPSSRVCVRVNAAPSARQCAAPRFARVVPQARLEDDERENASPASAGPDEAGDQDNGFVSEHKANMRELRKLLLEKRKELERKRVASFHTVKDAVGKNTASLKDTLSTFAKAEMDFVKSLFPEMNTSASACKDNNTVHEEIVPEIVVDPLEAKMDPDYEGPKKL